MKLTSQTRVPDVIVDADSFFDIHMSFNTLDGPEKIANQVYLNIVQNVKNSFGGFFYMTITPKGTFRNRIYPLYKHKRPERSQIKSDALSYFAWKYAEKTVFHDDFEADDIVVYFMKRGSRVLAIDKDILGVAEREIFNYKTKKYIHPINPLQIEENIVYQSMMGDSTDGIPGAEGIGKAKALKKIKDGIDVFEWVQLFGSIEQAELMMRLVRMDQITDEIELKLWRVEDWKLR